jgi:hypothetical protein
VSPTNVGFRSRPATYTLIIGVVTGMLAAGLGIPFVFGTPLSSVNRSAVSPLAGGSASNLSGTASGGGTDASASAGGVASPSNGGLATSAGGTQTTSGSLAAGSAGVPGLTASDRGVTATTITVAFVVVDLGSVSKLGFGVPGFDVKSQETYVSTFVNNINAHGGVYGRKIVPVPI